MSKVRIEKLLRKIGVVLQDDDLSALEKDLAKKYLIEIYDLIDDAGKTEVRVESNPRDLQRKDNRLRMDTSHSPQPNKVEAPDSSEKSNRVTNQTREEPKKDRTAVKSFDSPIVPSEELLEGKSNQPRVEILSQTNRVIVEPTHEQVPLNVPSDFRHELREVATRVNPVPEKHKVLFKRDNQNELSDKLSLSPIADLRRALGINDKLLVVNQLFMGDRESYQETVDVLNAKYSFADAQSYLVRYIIDKFDWLNEERIEPARDFIKLVQRRFLET